MSARTPRVLLVGQGPPARGGIPTFIQTLLDDPELTAAVRFSYRNTTRDPTRPGGATLRNLRWTLTDVAGVFRAARRADVVHLHLAPAPLLPLVRAGALIAASRAGGARALLHAHSGRLHVAAGSAAYRVVLKVVARLADRVLVVSEDGAKTIRAAGGRAEVVVNAIDTSLFHPAARDPARLEVVFVGTVCERKGLDDLRLALGALRRRGALPDPLSVTIVGDGRQEGPGAFERVREAYASDGLGLVRFVGARPPDAVREILAAADVFVLPSHWEGLPLSLLEAMAAGAAPVATRVGDVPEVLDQGAAGILVDPHRPDELAEALARLFDDPGERARLGAAARARAVATYDRTAMGRRLLELYREAAYSR